VNATTKLQGIVAVTLAVAVSGAAVCAAAANHPALVGGAACVSAQCHALLLAAAGATGGSAHPPAAGGECVSCHDLALAAQSRFVKGWPAGDAGEAAGVRAWDLALCSGCHGAELYATRAAATGFADGARNLHALHVQAGRGRRCLSCHEPHAAGQPQLLRSRLPAQGGRQVAQEFRGEPQGGWCRTGCHAPKRYRR
jgi:predicted CXXCH cytochrome family protein